MILIIRKTRQQLVVVGVVVVVFEGNNIVWVVFVVMHSITNII